MGAIKDSKEIVELLDNAKYQLRGRMANWYVQSAVDKINQALKANNEEAIELLGDAKWLLRKFKSNLNVQLANFEINKAIRTIKKL